MSQARYSIIPTAALEDTRVTPTQLKVLAVLGAYLSKELVGFPKQKEIAERAYLSRQTVNKALQKLSEYGYVKVIGQARQGLKRALKYRVILDVKIDDIDAETVMDLDVKNPDNGEDSVVKKGDNAVSADVKNPDIRPSVVKPEADSLLSSLGATTIEDTQLKIPTHRAPGAGEVCAQILDLLPKAKRKLARPKPLEKVVKTVIRDHPVDVVLGAVRRCYVEHERHTVEEGQYAPAVLTWLRDGTWKMWTDDEATTTPASLTDEEWKTAMRHFVDTLEWPIPSICPPPNREGCQAPASMLRHAAKLLQVTRPGISLEIMKCLTPAERVSA